MLSTQTNPHSKLSKDWKVSEASKSGRHTWWYAKCVKHSEQPHMTILDDKCVECIKEKENAK